MSPLWLILLGAAVVLLIFLEGKRQERALGKRASGQPNLVGNAMLEAQAMLEPERKVETMQEVLQKQDRIEAEHDQQQGEPEPGDDDPRGEA